MTTAATATTTSEAISVFATDVSGQKKVRVGDVSRSATVGELVRGLLARMGLVTTDTKGAPLNYRARLKRDGRHLHGAEIVGDALRPDDEITLQPRINAG